MAKIKRIKYFAYKTELMLMESSRNSVNEYFGRMIYI